MRVLGVDPGSRTTGFGLVEQRPGGPRYLESGVIRTGNVAFNDRLGVIFGDLCALIERQRPDTMVVEQVFVRHNVASALKLGQARGAVICAGAQAGLAIHEYTASVAKLALVGHGRASKRSMQDMVRLVLGLPAAPPEDAADALALALCHLQQLPLLGQTATSATNPRVSRS